MEKEVFISYSSKEAEQAYLVKGVLQKNGISCWMAPESIGPGSNYTREIPKGIRECKVLVLLLSEASQSSMWVEKEVERAISLQKIIIPFAISKCNLAGPFEFMLSNVQRIEAYEETSKHLEQLVKNIKGLLGESRAEEPVAVKKEVVQPTEISVSVSDEKEENAEKIGALVQKTMLRFIEEGLLSEELLVAMQDKVWCKQTLHISYPMLLKLVPEQDIRSQLLDDKGRARYWATPYLIDGETYCICNDWYEKHREYFEQFVAQVEAGNEIAVSREKKVFSVTGDVTYSIYGKEYTENQSDMMLRVFAQVLKRHQDKVDSLSEQEGMNCVAKYQDIDNPGTAAAKPTYFRMCHNFEFDNGSEICVGTAFSSGDKMKKIARLLDICEEDRTVFRSEQLELPEAGKSRVAGSGVEYTFYGKKYNSDQTEMMCHVCSTVISKNPDKLDELVTNTLCIGNNDSSITEKSYFRVVRVYNVAGREYCIGTAFSMADKMRQISKVFGICGESSDALQVEGHEFVVKPPKEKMVKAVKVTKNFMD